MSQLAAISVSIADQQTALPLDRQQLRTAVRTALAGTPLRKAKIGLAVVDDATIARLNRQFLDHEGPTDVLSFPLARRPGAIEGEIVVSAETAQREAAHYGWTPHDELLLYVIHGVLHLAGYDDHSPRDRAQMRAREREVLEEVGIRKAEVGIWNSEGGEKKTSFDRGTCAGRSRNAKGGKRPGRKPFRRSRSSSPPKRDRS